MGGTIGVLVILEGSTDEEAAKDIAMHIAALNPKYVSRDKFLQKKLSVRKKFLLNKR